MAWKVIKNWKQDKNDFWKKFKVKEYVFSKSTKILFSHQAWEQHSPTGIWHYWLGFANYKHKLQPHVTLVVLFEIKNVHCTVTQAIKFISIEEKMKLENEISINDRCHYNILIFAYFFFFFFFLIFWILVNSILQYLVINGLLLMISW